MPKSKVDSHITVGKRYVFFTSLTSNDEKNLSLNALGRHAEHELSRIDAKLTGQAETNQIEQQEKINYIQEYLNLLKTTADHMKDNELAFITQQTQQLKKIQDFIPNTELSEINNLLNDINQSEEFDYMKFITLLNNLMLEPNKRNKIIQEQLNNMRLLQKNFNNMTEEEQRKAQEAYIENYRKYKNDFSQNLFQQFNNETIYIPSITSVAAEKITSIISSLSNNPILLEALATQIRANKKITNKNILEALIAIITDAVFDNPSQTVDELIESITKKVSKDTSNIINNFLEQNSFEIFNTKTQRSLEQLAMRKENEFEGLANAVLNINKNELKDLFQLYDKNNKYGLKKLYKLLTETLKKDDINDINNKKGQFTRALGQAIQDYLVTSVRQQKNNPNLSFNEIKQLISEQSDKYYKKRQLKKDLQTQLKVSQIKHSGIAEIMSTQDVQNRIVNIAFSRAPGNTINLKDDVSFMVGFTPKTDKINIKMDKINKKIAQEYKNYLPEYKEIARGLTNIEASRKIFSKKINNIINSVQEQLKVADNDTEKLEKILDNFYDTFLGSISVKDYELYNNELGFHGGSLGGQGTVDTVIENIVQMYEIGGISKLDADELIFAVINSTENDSTYGNGSNKQHIANFLLGGAALMMFDEGFSNSKKFLEDTKSTLFTNNHIRTLQLYRLNNIYLPASYILYTIYEQLLPIYNDIITNFTASTTTNRVEIISHNLTPADIKTGSDYPTSKDRWDYISSEATQNTKIQFLFMAGMLDIFENLAKAFRI